jgi:hypothetical protein
MRALLLPFLLLFALSARADEIREVPNPASSEEDDFSESPFTEYGEFNEDEDEAAAADFFQFGRFFGVSAGGGMEGATGNRGLLLKGGFPLVTLKVHYWFDYNFALSMGFFTASHYYEAPDANNVLTNVNITQFGLELYAYLPNRNASAALTFAHPYAVVGIGSYSKSESVGDDNTTTKDATFGFNAGAGLEFLVQHRKTYFQLEGRLHFVNYQDTYSSRFLSTSAAIPDLTGAFYTLTGAFMFVW